MTPPLTIAPGVTVIDPERARAAYAARAADERLPETYREAAAADLARLADAESAHAALAARTR